MPRPVYILCSDGGAVDLHTQLESVFNIFDVVQVTITETGTAPKNAQLVHPVRMRVSVVWERMNDRESASEFDHELVVHYPGKRESRVMVKGKFQFTLNRQRFMYLLPGLPIFEEGVITLESRIRRRGSRKWMSQAYRLQVKVARQQIETADTKRSRRRARR